MSDKATGAGVDVRVATVRVHTKASDCGSGGGACLELPGSADAARLPGCWWRNGAGGGVAVVLEDGRDGARRRGGCGSRVDAVSGYGLLGCWYCQPDCQPFRVLSANF